MKKQIEAKLLKNFGFSNKEIAKHLNTTQKFVRTAISSDSISAKIEELGINPTDKQIKAMGTRELIKLARHSGKMFDRYSYKRAADTTVPYLELILSWDDLDIKRFNRRLKAWGNRPLSEFYKIKETHIVSLKEFFGYFRESIPYDYHDKIHYLPITGRLEVKKRDEMVCARCNRKQENYRFFKINQPGPNIADNYVIMCKLCRETVMRRGYYKNEPERNLDEFRRFIKDY